MTLFTSSSPEPVGRTLQHEAFRHTLFRSSTHKTPQSISHFKQFVNAVIGKVHDLLDTPVVAADANGRILAASQPKWETLHLDVVDTQVALPYLQLPLSLDTQIGQLRIYQVAQDDAAVQLTRRVVQLAIDQILLEEQLPNYHRLKDKFLYNLLYGLIADPSIIELYAQQLDLNLAFPRAVLLVDASNYVMDVGRELPYAGGSLRVERRAGNVIKHIVDFFSLPDDTICAYMGDGEIAILKATDTRNLVSWAEDQPASPAPSWANLAALKRAADILLSALTDTLQTTFTISIGRHHPGVTGLARSYQDARAALSLGLRFYGPNHVHCLDSLGIAAFAGISDERIKSDLAAHILSPLDHESELIDSLSAFFKANCSPSQAAAALSIHRNTLNYRLDKITALIGLDPRRFDDAVQIRLALLLRAA